MTNSTAALILSLSPARIAEILDRLNAYEADMHAAYIAERHTDNEGDTVYNVWEDVVSGIAEYDEQATTDDWDCGYDNNNFVAGGILFEMSASAGQAGRWTAEPFDTMATDAEGAPLDLQTLSNEELRAYSDEADQARDTACVRTIRQILASR